MKKILLLGSLIILIGFLMYTISEYLITGKIILEDEKNYTHTYTKAICDEKNFCQDYTIICNDNQVIDKIPITGAIIQHAPYWEDPRDKETIDKFCNFSA